MPVGGTYSRLLIFNSHGSEFGRGTPVGVCNESQLRQEIGLGMVKKFSGEEFTPAFGQVWRSKFFVGGIFVSGASGRGRFFDARFSSVPGYREEI